MSKKRIDTISSMDNRSVENKLEPILSMDSRSVGEYITYQCGVLNTILGFLSYDELYKVQPVCKEWLRAIKMIKEKQHYFITTIYLLPTPISNEHKNNVTNIKLYTDCLSFLLSSKLFEKINSIKMINEHLLEIYNHDKLRIFSGNYLPPINIHTSLYSLLSKPKSFHLNDRVQKKQLTKAVIHQRIYFKPGDISIYECCSDFNRNNLKQLLKNLKKPIKGIMVFNKTNDTNGSNAIRFRKLVQEIQDEPFTMAGALLDYDVLLPSSISNPNCIENPFDTTFVVFSGDLKVTSIKLRRVASQGNYLDNLIDNLYNRAGSYPLNATRIIYIFECFAVKKWSRTIFDSLLVKFPNVEIVVITSQFGEIYFDTFNPTDQSIDDHHAYSVIISVYDFKDCSYQCKYENTFEGEVM